LINLSVTSLLVEAFISVSFSGLFILGSFSRSLSLFSKLFNTSLASLLIWANCPSDKFGKSATKTFPWSLKVKKVIFLPDDFLAKYVASQTSTEIISWKGTCEVHEQFKDEEINEIRKANPGIKIIAHPECPPDVIQASDFAGSTSGMIKYVKDNQPEKVMMVTECSMSDNVQIDNPNVEFIRPCNLCPHMKRITLPKILDCLENETNELIMDHETIERARKSVERMAEIGR